MAVIRDTVNLTKLTNKALRQMVGQLTSSPEVKAQFDHIMTYAQNFGDRNEVHTARVAVDAWTHCHTVTTHTEPSPESLDWSNLEGGHIFHQVPSFKAWFDKFMAQ